MWKAKIILTDVLSIEFPTMAELEFVSSVINGGKTDHTENEVSDARFSTAYNVHRWFPRRNRG